jgi:Na+/proline symporter
VVIALIVAYTVEGGVKTIVWTDLLQTACMLSGLAVVAWILLARHRTSTSLRASPASRRPGLSRMFALDPMAGDFVGKQFDRGHVHRHRHGRDGPGDDAEEHLGETLAGSQKNVLLMAVVMMAVVLGFLYLGGLLHLYAASVGITETGDRLFPAVVMQRLPEAVQIVFLIALISALFPSADGALTALTSSFCMDILRLRERPDVDEAAIGRIRKRVHLAFAAVFLVLVLGFEALGNPSMITVLLTIAAYSYGPLLGLFAFAIFAKRRLDERWVPVVAIAAPVVCFVIDRNQAALFGAYRIGLEMLVLNGALTFAGLWMISTPAAGEGPTGGL